MELRIVAISRAATEALSSEYDRTFHIAAEEGAYYLLKVVPPTARRGAGPSREGAPACARGGAARACSLADS